MLERNGINVMTADDFKRPKQEYQQAITNLTKAKHERPRFTEEISTYRKYVPIILEYCEELEKINRVLFKTFDRYENDSQEKRYKRWSEEEDNILIEMVCSDRSMLEVSTAMGRTVPSIKSRVTKLVGLKRLSQEIVGRFVGTIDGKEADGEASGTLYKYKGDNNAD